MTRHEKQLKAVRDEMSRYAEEMEAIFQKADAEGRPPTEEENLEVNTRRKALKALQEKVGDLEQSIEIDKEIIRLGAKSDDGGLEFRQTAQAGERRLVKSLGEMLTESAGFKSAQESGFPAGWKASVEFGVKGTMLEGSSSPGSGTGGGLLPVPQVEGGVTRKLFQRLSVEDLIPHHTASGNTVRYVVEGTATSGAAGVAEAGAKPESTLALSTVDEPVKKIATSLHVADELLEDADAVASYINQRLSLFVQIEAERQLGRGAGTNEIYGFISSGAARGNISIYAGGTAAGNKAVQLFKALNGTRGSSFLEPEAIIIHPTDWQEIRLLTDTAGQFFGGGPFQGPYGNGENVAASGQVTGAQDYLWGKPVIVTTALGNAGTALLGAFAQASALYDKGGVRVDMTNSHDDLFLKDITTIRAERRFALAIYRPTAFCRVDLG